MFAHGQTSNIIVLLLFHIFRLVDSFSFFVASLDGPLFIKIILVFFLCHCRHTHVVVLAVVHAMLLTPFRGHLVNVVAKPIPESLLASLKIIVIKLPKLMHFDSRRIIVDIQKIAHNDIFLFIESLGLGLQEINIIDAGRVCEPLINSQILIWFLWFIKLVYVIFVLSEGVQEWIGKFGRRWAVPINGTRLLIVECHLVL